MTFGVVTKKIDFNLYRSKIKELSLIMSLLPSINLVKALEKFNESPLLPLILNPETDDYELTRNMNPDLKELFSTSSTPELLLKVITVFARIFLNNIFFQIVIETKSAEFKISNLKALRYLYYYTVQELNYTQLSAVRKIADVAIRREPKIVLIEGSPGKNF